jgi:O-antigen ligase
MPRESEFNLSRLAFIPACFYAVGSLSSMAGMSISIGVAVLMILAFMAFRSGFASSWRERAGQLGGSGTLIFSSALLAASIIISLLTGWLYPLTFENDGVSFHPFKDSLKLAYFALPFIWGATLGLLGPAHRERFILVWTGFAGLLGVLSIVQFFTGFPHAQPIPTSPPYFHATLFFGHHLSTASILIFPFFVALARGTEGPRRVRDGLLALLIGTALFLSYSRMAWIALPLGLGVFLLKYINRRSLMRLVLVSGLILAVAAPLAWKVPAIRERISNPMGISTRLELWKINIGFFTQRPWFGVGFRKNQALTHAWTKAHIPDPEVRKNFFVGHAHNNLIDMLSGTGIAGTLSWLFWNAVVLGIAWRGSRASGFEGQIAWGIFCAWIVLHLNGLTQVNFWEGKVMHQWTFALGILLAFVRTRPRPANN